MSLKNSNWPDLRIAMNMLCVISWLRPIDIEYQFAYFYRCCLIVFFQAALLALTENITTSVVTMDHFLKSLTSVLPSLNAESLQNYSQVLTSHWVRLRKSIVLCGYAMFEYVDITNILSKDWTFMKYVLVELWDNRHTAVIRA